MAAEEKRKQKEQIKIMKQQVNFVIANSGLKYANYKVSVLNLVLKSTWHIYLKF